MLTPTSKILHNWAAPRPQRNDNLCNTLLHLCYGWLHPSHDQLPLRCNLLHLCCSLLQFCPGQASFISAVACCISVHNSTSPAVASCIARSWLLKVRVACRQMGFDVMPTGVAAFWEYDQMTTAARHAMHGQSSMWGASGIVLGYH